MKCFLWFCSIILFTISTALAHQDVNALKSKNEMSSKEFVMIGSRLYYFSNYKTNFQSAMRACNELGMALVSLETAAENALVKQYMLDAGLANLGHWTSGHKIGTTWMWSSTGFELNFTDWWTNQPDVTNTEEGVCIYFSGETGWWDQECSFESPYFICEELS